MEFGLLYPVKTPSEFEILADTDTATQLESSTLVVDSAGGIEGRKRLIKIVALRLCVIQDPQADGALHIPAYLRGLSHSIRGQNSQACDKEHSHKNTRDNASIFHESTPLIKNLNSPFSGSKQGGHP